MTFDVIVLGAGPGGLAAAVTGARCGLRVCLVDALDRLGGNAAISTGYVSVLGSDEQLSAGIQDTAELFVHDLRREVDQYRDEHEVEFDEQLAREFCLRTTAVYRLLRELGCTFDGFVNKPAQHSVPRLLKVSDPDLFRRLFARECARLGITTYLGTTATALGTENGRVAKVTVRDAQGGEQTVHASSGVVVTTGGYQANPAMRKESRADLADSAHLGVETCVGAGQQMMARLGAPLTNMGFLPSIVMIGSALAEDTICVAADGRRHYDETGPSEDRNQYVGHAEGPLYYVFDHRAYERYPNLVGQFPEPVLAAGSLAELAGLIGCDGAGRARTVDEWNRTVATGSVPDEVGRVILPPSAQGIVTPPFHATRCRIGSAFTIGGVRIDSGGRVLDAGAKPIPGLYAAGDCVGSLNASSGTAGVHLTSALAFGQAAAETLVAEAARR
ncbi:MAG TPA: FAD-dependent oxidoreductase [Amycolatopsis sp.]|nr:FAD-dependent oxidoreductase [Amycolatopsis sp.]